VAEGAVELAVQVGFVAEEAGEVFGVGEEGLVQDDQGALFQLLLGLALRVVLQGGDGGLEATVGAAGFVGGEATAAPLDERELAGELFLHGADGVEVGGEGVAEGLPLFHRLVLQDDGVGGGEAVLDGVGGGAGFAGSAIGAADAGAGGSGEGFGDRE
jgi:hypothetical protein